MDIQKFKEALQEELSRVPPEAHVEFLKKKLSSEADPSVKSVLEIYIDARKNISYNAEPNENILVLIHGIRTEAVWQDLLVYLLEDEDIEVKSIRFGWLDVIRFWLPYICRRGPISTVLDELRDIRNMHRNANISIVAHSFGTYILSRILANSVDVQLHRVILCGCIVKENFRWSAIPRYPTDRIINDCGTKDILPLLAKKLSWGYGASGRDGFNSSRINNRYHNVGHSGFFNEEFVKTFWLPFITDGIVKQSDWSRKRPSSNYILRFLTLIPIKSTVLVGLVLLINMVFPIF